MEQAYVDGMWGMPTLPKPWWMYHVSRIMSRKTNARRFNALRTVQIYLLAPCLGFGLCCVFLGPLVCLLFAVPGAWRPGAWRVPAGVKKVGESRNVYVEEGDDNEGIGMLIHPSHIVALVSEANIASPINFYRFDLALPRIWMVHAIWGQCHVA